MIIIIAGSTCQQDSEVDARTKWGAQSVFALRSICTDIAFTRDIKLERRRDYTNCRNVLCCTQKFRGTASEKNACPPQNIQWRPCRGGLFTVNFQGAGPCFIETLSARAITHLLEAAVYMSVLILERCGWKYWLYKFLLSCCERVKVARRVVVTPAFAFWRYLVT